MLYVNLPLIAAAHTRQLSAEYHSTLIMPWRQSVVLSWRHEVEDLTTLLIIAYTVNPLFKTIYIITAKTVLD